MINARYRFHGHGSLRYVFSNGKAYRSSNLTLRVVKNKFRKNPRMAVVVSKKVLKSAVGRNRIRRRIYSRLQAAIPSLNDNYDIVVIVNSPEVRQCPSLELDQELNNLLNQAELF